MPNLMRKKSKKKNKKLVLHQEKANDIKTQNHDTDKNDSQI